MEQGTLIRGALVKVGNVIRLYPKNSVVKIEYISGPLKPETIDNSIQAMERLGDIPRYFFNCDTKTFYDTQEALVESATAAYLGYEIMWGSKGVLISAISTIQLTEFEVIQAMEKALNGTTSDPIVEAEEDSP